MGEVVEFRPRIDPPACLVCGTPVEHPFLLLCEPCTAEFEISEPELEPVAPPSVGGTVYVLRDWEERVIYVGVTGRGLERLHEHGRTKEWWTQVRTATFEHWPSMMAARVREAQLIAAHTPDYNHPQPRRWLAVNERIDQLARQFRWADRNRQARAPFGADDLVDAWWDEPLLEMDLTAPVAIALGTYLGQTDEPLRLPNWYG